MTEGEIHQEGTFENPHILTQTEREQAEGVMKGFLGSVFTTLDRGATHLTKDQLGSETTEGLVRLTLSHNDLVGLYDIGWGMGLSHEMLQGLSDHPTWKQLCQDGRPHISDPLQGFDPGKR
jgi:hypothetical protein